MGNINLEKFAWLAGLVASDGHIEKDRNRVTIYSKNKQFIEKIKRKIEELVNESPYVEFTNNTYRIRITSHNLVKVLTERFNIPPGKKCDKISLPPIFQKKFLEGFIDGDGSVHLIREKHRYKCRIYTYIVPEFSLRVKSKKFLEGFVNFCKKRCVTTSKIYLKKDGCYEVRVRGWKEFLKFIRIFHFSHPQKVKKIREILNSTPPKVRP